MTHSAVPAATTSAGDHVTIVMITHNRREELCRSLKNLQALPEQPLIIVVDNASTDDTVERVRNDFPDIKLIRSEQNLGAAGRNLGVQQVHTPYVAFCDDDTWWEAGSLKMAVSLLEQHQNIAVLNAHIVVGPEQRPDPACREMAASPLPHVSGIGPTLTGFMAGACVMRVAVFLQVGGYWAPFFIGSEEAVLAMDILDAGHCIVYAPALTVHHWPSQRRDARQRVLLTERNAIWTAWLRLPIPLAWQRTRAALRTISDIRQRYRLLISALTGARAVLLNRRVLRPQTSALLSQVWDHEKRGRHDAVIDDVTPPAAER